MVDMTNIPTDLLRTLIAVIDLRSFTRAAQSLGVTQPAVSAQIKRLQLMLGVDLFDKSAPGVTLTASGEVMVNYARRILALNDQMLDATTRGGAAARLRVGIAVDYFENVVLDVLTAFRAQHPGLRIQITSTHSASVLRDLRRGEYDLAVAGSESEEPLDERRRWFEPTAWGAASPAIADREGPVPLLVVGESSLSRRLSVAALEQAGVDYEIVYIGGSFAGLSEAARAGLGVACWARRLLRDAGVPIIEASRRLPKLSGVWAGVYVRDGAPFAEIDTLADTIAARMRAIGGVGVEEPALRIASHC
jgi:DNA-binding transcriptional LysR family regulator